MAPLYVCLSIVVIIVVIALLARRNPAMEVTAEAAREMVKDPQLVVLDVRTPQEFAQGHIEGARLIPVAELPGRLAELAEFKNRPILIYCYRGSRSASVYHILQKNGFSILKNLRGGIMAWTGAGNKVLTEPEIKMEEGTSPAGR
jgi:rhodanese-related sulfurtransferase